MNTRLPVPPARAFLGAAAIAVAAGLAACSQRADPAWSGYIEGEYVYVASPIGGTLQSLDARRGQAVARGAPLYSLESESEEAARAEAAARAAAALAQARNTQSGRRHDEVAMTEAQGRQARAEADFAAAELARQEQLLAQGFVSPSRLDDARTAVERTRQRVAEMSAASRVARLPARDEERAAATAAARAAEQAVRQSEWRLRQKRPSSPADAIVAETYFRVGEWVQPGQPVVALLPAGHTKARFFVPEAEIASIAVGQTVDIRCDGCGEPIAARIDFIATRAEYTPPVIYSNAQRARLVFMVEARPRAEDAARLKPGQPVDVRALPQPAASAKTGETGASR